MPKALADEDTLRASAVERSDASHEGSAQQKPGRSKWLIAAKEVWPIYLATHIAFLALTYLVPLFFLGNFSSRNLPLISLLNNWNHWDTAQFTSIALNGYQAPYRTAFFPLYPLMEGGLAFIIRNAFIAGLIISNVATLGMFIVLYQLVVEDFDRERAWRSVLYLAVFPTAFFFAAAYNESLFIFLSLLSFYFMRKGRWWLAGLVAIFTSLTRSSAICLFVPFFYEYFRQHHFRWQEIRFTILAALGITGGVLIFGFYGYMRFHDFLAFSHAQAVWGRQIRFPGWIFLVSYHIFRTTPILTFYSIHTVIDIISAIFILLLLVLGLVGPWKLAREHWSYVFYGLTLYLLFILVPETGGLPTASLSRFMLEIFPAFIMLATLGKRRSVNLYYLAICLPLLGFFLLQWLTGKWMV